MIFYFSGTGNSRWTAEQLAEQTGDCAQHCPAAIAMTGGKPVWGQRCYQCLRCINECPQRAIQYSKATASRGRYTISRYEKRDL